MTGASGSSAAVSFDRNQSVLLDCLARSVLPPRPSVPTLPCGRVPTPAAGLLLLERLRGPLGSRGAREFLSPAIAREAEAGEAEQHHDPGRRLGRHQAAPWDFERRDEPGVIRWPETGRRPVAGVVPQKVGPIDADDCQFAPPDRGPPTLRRSTPPPTRGGSGATAARHLRHLRCATAFRWRNTARRRCPSHRSGEIICFAEFCRAREMRQRLKAHGLACAVRERSGRREFDACDRLPAKPAVMKRKNRLRVGLRPQQQTQLRLRSFQ